MIKTRIKNFLVQHDFYYRLKYSKLFGIYEYLFKPSAIKQQKKEVEFYKSFLPGCKLIFDIGAYDGHKTKAFLEISGRVVCCEPDKTNYGILQTRFRKQRKRVFIERKALSDHIGQAMLHIHHPGSAFNTLTGKWLNILEADNLQRWDEKISFTQKETVETTTLDALIDKYGVPDFIKIDTEGSEEAVLKGLSQPVSYLSFETLLPDYSKELQTCLERIESIGRRVKYNIAVQEKLSLDEFVTKDALGKYLHTHPIRSSFEVIVNMSA